MEDYQAIASEGNNQMLAINETGKVFSAVILGLLLTTGFANAQTNIDPNLNAAAPAKAGDQGARLNPQAAPRPVTRPQADAGIDLRLDFSNQESSTVGNWNNISNLTGLTSDLIDFHSGTGTGVSIDGLGSPWQNFVGDGGAAFPEQDWLVQPAPADGAGLSNNLTGSFEISGLPGTAYRIEIVSARPTFGYLNTITVNGAAADRTFLGTPVVTPWNSTADGLVPGNWLIWDDIMPASGVITVTNVSGPDTLGMINAMRIFEPSDEPPPPVVPPTPAIPVPTQSVWGLLLLTLMVAGSALLRQRKLSR